MNNQTKKAMGNEGKFLLFSALLILTLIAYYFVNARIDSTAFFGEDETSYDLSACKYEELDDERISLTVPAFFATDATQDKLDQTAKELGYESMTLDEEGNITYVLTKQQHEEMVSNLRTGIDSSFKKLIGKGAFKKVKSIEANQDLTYIKVTLITQNIDSNTSLSLIQLKTYCTMYYVFSANYDSKLTVEYYDGGNRLLTSFHSDTSGEEASEAVGSGQ